jgi:hypothetical protein
MKTFTIDNENNISVFATQEEAAAATATQFDSFASQQELADLASQWPAERLQAVWNSLPGVTPVKKFTDRKTAISRIWARLQGLGEPVAPKTNAPATTPVGIPAATPATTPVGKPAAKPEAKADQLAKPKAERKGRGGARAAEGGAQSAKGAPGKGRATKNATAAKNPPKGKKAAKTPGAAAPREGSKTAQVIAMLQRKGGVTISEIMKTMGWQRHTVRGFMAGAMKKAGYAVESFKPEGGERSYRINK